MKIKLCTLTITIAAACFLLNSSIIAQDYREHPGPKLPADSLLKVARTIIDSARCRVFVTVDENGKPHAREMSPFPPEENWVIWLGTTQGSGKTKQIEKNSYVVIFYYEIKGMSYVSVSGKASLVNDPDKKAKYWVDGWKQFYADRDKDYVLIEVKPEKVEVCSFQYGLLWDPVTGAPQSVDFNAIEPEKK